MANKQLRDQSAHLSIALLALTPLAAHPGLLTGALAGFLMGMVREVTEEGDLSLRNINAALGSWLDLTFWTLGGALAGIIA